MSKKLKITNQIMFYILVIVSFLYVLYCYSFDGSFLINNIPYLLMLNIPIILLAVLTFIEIKKGEKIVYDNKYNYLILIYNITLIVSVVFLEKVYMKIGTQLNEFIVPILYFKDLPLIYNLLNIESYKNLFKKKN